MRSEKTFRHNWIDRIATKLPFVQTSDQDDIEKVESDKPDKRRDSRTLSITATRSPPPTYNSPELHPEPNSTSKAKDNGQDVTLGETLLDLISDVKEHIAQLINADGAYGSTPAVNRVVTEVLKEENFSVRNKELVMSDDDLKRFICEFLGSFSFTVFILRFVH